MFFAGNDYKRSVELAKQFRADGWRYPGYDQVVTLVIDPASSRIRKELPSLDRAFLAEWPLPSYLAYCRVYPSLFFVTSDGKFEGFQLGSPGEPVYARPAGEQAK